MRKKIKDFTLAELELRSTSLILEEEAGYSNIKEDSGGETIFGITRKNFPSLKLWSAVDKIKTTGQPLSRKASDPVISSLKDDNIKEICTVYHNFYKAAYDICLKKGFIYLTTFESLYAFAVNAGISRMESIIENISKEEEVLDAVIAHYKRLLHFKKNHIFRKGWSHRLSRFSGKNIVL